MRARVLLLTAIIAMTGCSRPTTSPSENASAEWSGSAVRSGPSEEQLKAMARAPFANDLGPDAINVASYPMELQRSYQLFAQKCSKCHTLARPINSQYATRESWEHYVKQMWRKPGSNISGTEAKRIWEFLTYDGRVRKLSDPAAWRAHRQRLLGALKAEDPARYRELYEGREAEAVEPQ